MKMVDLKANTEYIFTFNIPINDRFSLYDTDGVAVSVAKNWSSDNTQLTFKMGNVDGYIGESTYGEIDWANQMKKQVFFLVEPSNSEKKEEFSSTAEAETTTE